MADDDGGTATASTSSIVVNNVAPVAQITGPLSGQEGSPLSFSAVVTDPGAADTFTYAWSVTKDGNPFTLPSDVDAASRNFSFTPPDNGSYDISLDVTDKDGASAATVTRTVNVLNAAPWVSIIGAPQASDEGTQINLSASALDPGVNDTLTYAWSVTKNGNPYTLPGGTVVDGSTFSFTPDDEGTFVASVTVTDNDGGQTTVTAQIAALNDAPTLTIAGEPGGGTSTRTDELAALCKRAGFDAKASPDIRSDIWYKLWGNMTMNPISAITGATCDRILDDPLLYRFCLNAMQEAADIGAKIGCPIAQSGEDRMAVTRKLGAFKTSMLQDAQAGKALEIDALVTVVHEIGKQVGVPTPSIDALLGMARLYGRVHGLY